MIEAAAPAERNPGTGRRPRTAQDVELSLRPGESLRARDRVDRIARRLAMPRMRGGTCAPLPFC
jgi:hypothetical protein